MIVAELKTHIGVLAIGGASCMVIGSLILFPSTQWLLYYQDIQQIQESLVAITLAMAVLFSFIVYKAAQSRRFKVRTGKEPLLGAQGVVVKDLAPEGQVRVLGEFWQARAQDGSISRDQNIRVVRLEGLFLIVIRVDEKA
jgi:membrane-bound serine protease (ClpP class)